jgi:hypothetical protein
VLEGDFLVALRARIIDGPGHRGRQPRRHRNPAQVIGNHSSNLFARFRLAADPGINVSTALRQVYGRAAAMR